MSALRVAYDVSAALDQGAGIGRYVRELGAALERLPDAPELLPYATRGAGGGGGAFAGRHPVRMLGVGSRAWRVLSYASQATRIPLPGWPPRCDVVHATDGVTPFTGRVPAVVTVHDLSFLRTPEFHTPLNRAALSHIVPRATRNARLVIADSNATARDLESAYGLDPARIRVIYPGCDLERFRPLLAEDPRPVLARYGITQPYLLFVGTLEPRKNLVGLIDAYERLAADGLDHRLVLAGSPGWGMAAIEARLASQRLGHRVIRAGRVAEEDLPTLYRAADAFVYPSHYEGFGLPPLEAMACGTPVVTSNRSSLPEVVGEAGVLVDPDDVASIARALSDLLGSAPLRAKLRAEGPRHAARFTWRRAAEQVAAAYVEAASKPLPKGVTT